MLSKLMGREILGVCGLLCWLPACENEISSDVARPNVLLISIDSLRADHLGTYGYERATSPVIDGLAAQGVRFEQVMSSTSWTLPSHASLFTGLPIAGHGCDSERPKLRNGAQTLAERLKTAGYQTAGFWSGPYLHPVFGLGQGFDEYVNCANFDYYKQNSARGQGQANQHSHEDITNPKLTSSVLEWMDGYAASAKENPFFLFVHMWDVHYDFLPPAPYDSMFTGDYTGPMEGTRMRQIPGKQLAPADMDQTRALYDGEIAWTDMHVGLVLDKLEALGWKQNTLVILTADHGEEFWERGDFGHRKTLFEESVRIPLVMRYPARGPAAKSIDAVASLVDIMPTILDAAGLGLGLGSEGFAGISLLPLWFDQSAATERWLFAELARPKVGESRVVVRSGDWKTAFDPENDALLGQWELGSDPGELRDLALESEGPGPEKRRLARAAYDSLRALGRRDRISQGASEPHAELPDEVQAALEEMGYVDKPEEEDEEEDG